MVVEEGLLVDAAIGDKVVRWDEMFGDAER